MKTFYLSFTGTIGLLCRGKLKWEALDEGLFYFGCNKAHAMWADKTRDGVDEWEWMLKDRDSGDFNPSVDTIADMKNRWRTAMEKADAEGRFLCRKSADGHSETTWSGLVALGDANGALINVPTNKRKYDIGYSMEEAFEDYCYPTAKEAIEASGHVAVY